MAKKKHLRFSRLRTRPKRIRKCRRSKNKKPSQIPAFVLSIVTYRITRDKSLIAIHRYPRRNTENNNFVIQKKGVKNYYIRSIENQKKTAVCFEHLLEKNSITSVTRILKGGEKTAKMPERLSNDLKHFTTTTFSFEFIINFLSFSCIGHYQILVTLKQVLDDRILPIHKNRTFSLTNQWTVTELAKNPIHSPDLQFIPNLTTYSAKKTEIENNNSNYLLTIINIEEYYKDILGDNQQSEVEEGTSAKNTATREDDSLYRHILELPSPYSPKQQQAFKDRLWDNDLDQVEKLRLSRYTDSQKHEIFDVAKPYRRFLHAVISHPSDGTEALDRFFINKLNLENNILEAFMSYCLS